MEIIIPILEKFFAEFFRFNFAEQLFPRNASQKTIVSLFSVLMHICFLFEIHRKNIALRRVLKPRKWGRKRGRQQEQHLPYIDLDMG